MNGEMKPPDIGVECWNHCTVGGSNSYVAKLPALNGATLTIWWADYRDHTQHPKWRVDRPFDIYLYKIDMYKTDDKWLNVDEVTARSVVARYTEPLIAYCRKLLEEDGAAHQSGNAPPLNPRKEQTR